MTLGGAESCTRVKILCLVGVPRCAVQVYIQEDEEQNIHFKNLSVHRAATEEEALNLVRTAAASLEYRCYGGMCKFVDFARPGLLHCASTTTLHT
jgi:uncharacterized protein YaeQ